MALNNKNPETERLVHELAAATVADIQAFVASLPDRDDRTPDEVLGYDEFGLCTDVSAAPY